MVAAIENLPMLMQQHFDLISLGGGAMGMIVDEERRHDLRGIKQIILELGKDQRICIDSPNRWERVALDFVNFTRLEALNKDLKKPNGKMPTRAEIVAFLSGLDLEEKVEVVEGCPSSPDDKRLAELITASVYRDDVLVEQIHVSPKLKLDRRYTRSRDSINLLQQVALFPDFKLRDVVDGTEVNMTNLRDAMPSLKNDKISHGDRLVYLSRYILNLIRGFEFINGGAPKGDWKPQILNEEYNNFIVFLRSIPDFIKNGSIREGDLTEFRLRMMGCYMINPRLFINIAVDFGIDAVFPFFDKIVSNSQIYEDLTMPKNAQEELDLLREIQADRFEYSMSALANVAKMFGMGVGGGVGMKNLWFS